MGGMELEEELPFWELRDIQEIHTQLCVRVKDPFHLAFELLNASYFDAPV